jgi:hypothetical protein
MPPLVVALDLRKPRAARRTGVADHADPSGFVGSRRGPTPRGSAVPGGACPSRTGVSVAADRQSRRHPPRKSATRREAGGRRLAHLVKRVAPIVREGSHWTWPAALPRLGLLGRHHCWILPRRSTTSPAKTRSGRPDCSRVKVSCSAGIGRGRLSCTASFTPSSFAAGWWKSAIMRRLPLLRRTCAEPCGDGGETAPSAGPEVCAGSFGHPAHLPARLQIRAAQSAVASAIAP